MVDLCTCGGNRNRKAEAGETNLRFLELSLKAVVKKTSLKDDQTWDPPWRRDSLEWLDKQIFPVTEERCGSIVRFWLFQSLTKVWHVNNRTLSILCTRSPILPSPSLQSTTHLKINHCFTLADLSGQDNQNLIKILNNNVPLQLMVKPAEPGIGKMSSGTLANEIFHWEAFLATHSDCDQN